MPTRLDEIYCCVVLDFHDFQSKQSGSELHWIHWKFAAQSHAFSVSIQEVKVFRPGYKNWQLHVHNVACTFTPWSLFFAGNISSSAWRICVWNDPNISLKVAVFKPYAWFSYVKYVIFSLLYRSISRDSVCAANIVCSKSSGMPSSVFRTLGNNCSEYAAPDRRRDSPYCDTEGEHLTSRLLLKEEEGSTDSLHFWNLPFGTLMLNYKATRQNQGIHPAHFASMYKYLVSTGNFHFTCI